MLLICDIGGVLVKTDEAIIHAIKQSCEELGIRHGDVEDIYMAFGVSVKDYISAYTNGESVEEIYAKFCTHYPKHEVMSVFSGVNETLRILHEKGIKLAVISCMSKDEVDANLSLLSFDDFSLKLSIEDYKNK